MSEAGGARLLWLESYFDQSLTFSSWKKIETKVCQLLKENIKVKLMDPVQRQILFQILGIDFVNMDVPDHENGPDILDGLSKKEKDKKFSEMKSFIKSILDKIFKKNVSKDDGTKIQSDLRSFSKDLQNLIDIDHQKRLKEVQSKKQRAMNLNEKLLLEILTYDPSLINGLVLKFQGDIAILSDALRHIFWPACTASKEKGKSRKNAEKIKEIAQLYVGKQASYMSSVSADDLNNISTAVRKVYKETTSLKFFDSTENIRDSINILSIIHMYGMQFQPYYCYYVAVIQQVYLKKTSDDDDYRNAAVILDKLLRLCIPSSNQINKTTNKVLQILHEVDEELMNHIRQKCSYAIANKNDSAKSNSPMIMPAQFINQWITEGFVSILNFNNLLFIWDQLFLNKWEFKVIEEVCFALLGLLKPWFMLAKTREEIDNVFLKEPSYLYLLDIRKAFDHIHKKGSFLDLPRMNRNIRYEADPVPVLQPSLHSSKFVLTDFRPWVKYDREKSRVSAQPKRMVDQPFDFYIDSVRFVPDNATVVKITGKMLNMYFGQKGKSIKFQSFSDFGSHWRYPTFKLKQTVNRESVPINPDVVIMIRVYTIEQHSKEITVLGSCLFGPFSNNSNKQVSLIVGGHQIRVRHGIPNPEYNVENILPSHMDENPVIPGVTVLLRVLPHQKDYIEAPDYEASYYRSDEAKPSESELKLYKHYQDSKDFKFLVRDAALLLCGQASANNEALLRLIQQMFNREGSEVEDFPYQRFVHYDQAHGIMVLADKASGLPLFLEGRYLQCLVQILPGEETRVRDGMNQVSSFITEELDLESPQRSPDWTDPPTNVKPEYDEKCVVFVTLYGLRPRFDTSVQKVLDKEGREPNFNLQHAVAWSATNCFDKGAVYAGTHHIPLIKGRPSDDIIEKLSYLPLDYVCKKFKSQVKVFDTASIEVAIWDGRFSYDECPPLPTHTNFLNISLNPEKYIKASEHTAGVSVKALLKQGLPNQSEFDKDKDRILKLLKATFKENIDRSLKKAGYNATL